MIFIFYLFFLFFFIFLLNKVLINKNLLISETGDRHQKFASISKIPLTGGLLIFFGLLYFLNQNILSFIFFSFLILILGICSDLKLIESASKRFLFQISLVSFFIIFNDIQILDTRIDLLDKILSISFINYFFISFCILIVINGSNFIDGLNTLNLGYYLLISLIIFYLNLDQQISINNISMNYFILLLSLVFILNLLNKIYLGDSGSYLLGFSFSIFLISIYNWNKEISPFFIILLLWYPCYETLFSIIRKNILKRSPMSPDSHHLHQLIFFFIKKHFKLKVFFANLLTANIINIYNLFIFLIGLNFISNSQIQIILILLNLIMYTVIYFKTFIFKIKK
jgi:UDP-N-acetylmuramyl pentapeptide phosphotransferase/UDP-N-acetylglucosamine-1-phosphate transferase